jgi:preprotein translocase subunit SecY
VAKLAMFAQAFRTPDLRKKLLFTLGIITLYRFGASLPAPGISAANVRYCSGLAAGGSSGGGGQGTAANLYTMLNLFSGGSLLHVTVFALSIMPYITSSIIIQLLTEVIPRLQKLKDEGQAGQAKITQYTRYLTVGLALLIAAGYVQAARSGSLFSGSACSATNHPLIPHPSAFTLGTMVITMVSGTAVIMWMGELITERGIGNGMSVMIFTSVVAGIFGEGEQVYLTKGIPLTLALVAVVIALVACVVFIEQAQRRIPVQYAKRITGRRVYGGATTYIPVKVNQAGVVPVIFASSLLYLPQLGASVLGQPNQGWVGWVDRYLVPGTGAFPLYYIGYFLLILGFTWFYVSITFNPTEVAGNMQKYGGFVPGLRPGRITASYLGYVSSRLTAAGSVYLAAVALFPMIVLGALNVSSQIAFSGTSLLIVVGVGLDTVKQIQSQLHQHSYTGFMREPTQKPTAKPAPEISGSEGTSRVPAALNVS